jgi:hypothetical protein
MYVKISSVFKNVRHRSAENALPLPCSLNSLIPDDWLLPMKIAKDSTGSVLPPYILTRAFGPRLSITVFAGL